MIPRSGKNVTVIPGSHSVLIESKTSVSDKLLSAINKRHSDSARKRTSPAKAKAEVVNGFSGKPVLPEVWMICLQRLQSEVERLIDYSPLRFCFRRLLSFGLPPGLSRGRCLFLRLRSLGSGSWFFFLAQKALSEFSRHFANRLSVTLVVALEENGEV